MHEKSVIHNQVMVDSGEMFNDKGLCEKSSSQYRVIVINAKVDSGGHRLPILTFWPMIQAFSTGLGEPFFYSDTGLNCLSFFWFSMDIFSG